MPLAARAAISAAMPSAIAQATDAATKTTSAASISLRRPWMSLSLPAIAVAQIEVTR